jgi:hypothetical protein
VAFATDAVIRLWNLNGEQLVCLEFARGGSDGLGGADTDPRAKCTPVLHLQSSVFAVVLGVRAHLCVACWGTKARGMDCNRASVEVLRNCHGHQSLPTINVS